MSGIPVYTSSPLNTTAAKPSGITPPNPSNEPSRTTGPASVPADTTTLPTSTYPSAQPGSRPPAPTGTTNQYAPLQPTPTSSLASSGPAAPQPGAFPTPASKIVPPPPRVGEKYEPPTTSQSNVTPSYMPPQMGLPAPYEAIGSHSQPTSTSTAPSSSYPVNLQQQSSGRKPSLEHPPGYQQNTYASEMSADQRRAQQEAEKNNSSFNLSQSQGAGSGGFEDQSVWDTAKGYISSAGEKLSAVEAEVWKKINK